MSQALVLTEVPETEYQRMLLPATLATSGPVPQAVVGLPTGNLALKAAAPGALKALRAVSRSA